VIVLAKYLPPGTTHFLYNHLLGVLKWFQERKLPHSLYAQATILPLLSDLTLSMNGLKYSDFKKDRYDVFLATNGSFWFPARKSGTTEFPEAMFPTKLDAALNSEVISPVFQGISGTLAQLFCVYTIRISHLRSMTRFIKKHPGEVLPFKEILFDGKVGNRMVESPQKAEYFKNEPLFEQTFKWVAFSSDLEKFLLIFIYFYFYFFIFITGNTEPWRLGKSEAAWSSLTPSSRVYRSLCSLRKST